MWRKEDLGAARHRQEKREAKILFFVIAHGIIVEFCEATPIALVDESKESLYGRDRPRPA